jgi:hypothetical protein
LVINLKELRNGNAHAFTDVVCGGYSLIYLLGGGGVFGAVVIFVIAKMLGR